MKDAQEPVDEPAWRLLEENQPGARVDDNFGACMDAFQKRKELENRFARGSAPWGGGNDDTQEEKK